MRSSFSSKLGLILAAAGSAVGLGNIWKFPYVAGENGGGAFLLVYLVCVLLFGVPLIMMELHIGKRTGKSTYGAFRALSGSGRWQWLSWMCVTTAILIMGFYFVVTGWCFNYLAEALFNGFHCLSSGALSEHFYAITSDTPRMILFSLLPLFLTALVLWFDVNKGIERVSKVLMPLLFVMMVVMVVRVMMLPGSSQGLQFFFEADFSKLTPQSVLEAMGQCFFSLSIGMGALITYGSYMPKEQNISRASLQVVLLDTLVAIMAGLIIFPAVFSFGVNPEQGPQLVFSVLPAIFEQMASFSWIGSVLFFSLLGIAAITSTISLMEVVVAFLSEAKAGSTRPWSRRKSVLIVAAIAIVMVLACVLLPRLFDCFDKLTTCYLMPFGALSMSLLVGWSLRKPSEREHLQKDGFKPWMITVFIFILRWIVPLSITLIFLNGLGLLW